MNLFRDFVVAITVFLFFLRISIGSSPDNETNVNLKVNQVHKADFLSPS